MDDDIQILLRVAVAMALGAVVGLEREISDKPAGLRTHMLVSGAAALFVALADALVQDFQASASEIRADPIRVIEAVVAGVSFLGAGTIIRRTSEGSHVEGLTTAASLLAVSGVGVCVAVQRIWLAIGVVALLLAVLFSGRLLAWWRGRGKAAGGKEMP
jgi:putative Mg2+ transporter-C (MgtC) family protein